MRRTLIVFAILSTMIVKAQNHSIITLITDRDCYTSGETILFKLQIPETEQSEIIKTDLTDTGGKIVTGVYNNTDDHQTDGFIYIPDSLQTGTYLICSHTRKNVLCTMKEVFICNRFIGFSETTSILRAREIKLVPENRLNEIRIEGVDSIYKTRSVVTAQIKIPSGLIKSLTNHLLVKAVPANQEFKSSSFYMNSTIPANDKEVTKGIVLEGRVFDLATNLPAKNSCVLLSIPDSIPGLDYYITGEDGHFNFQLMNCSEKTQVIIQAIDLDKKRLLKLILNKTDSLGSSMPSFESEEVSTDLQKQQGLEMEETTLGKIFDWQHLNLGKIIPSPKQDYPFYGVATETVYTNQFVELPDFTEISRELLPGVKFRAINRIPTIQILNPATLNYFNDQPLVTLNGVPVHDLNLIKNLGSKEISRVEISRKERFYGDLIFPGVIAIFTPKDENRLLVESDELVKLELEGVQTRATLNRPQNLQPNEPDLSKVLLWQPGTKTEDTIAITFPTSDLKGKFKLEICANSKDGKLFSKQQFFDVK